VTEPSNPVFQGRAMKPQPGHDTAITGGQVGDCFFYEFIKLSLVDLHDRILLAEDLFRI